LRVVREDGEAGGVVVVAELSALGWRAVVLREHDGQEVARAVNLRPYVPARGGATTTASADLGGAAAAREL
jgi:hypothetical protein